MGSKITEDPSLVYCLAFGPSSSRYTSRNPAPAINLSHMAACPFEYSVVAPCLYLTSRLRSATELRSAPTMVCWVMSRASFRLCMNSLRARAFTGTYTLAKDRGGSLPSGGSCTVTAPAFRKVLCGRACLGPSPNEAHLMRTAVPPCVLVEGR